LDDLVQPPSKWTVIGQPRPPIGGTGKQIDFTKWNGPYLKASDLKPPVMSGSPWHIEYEHLYGQVYFYRHTFQNSTPREVIRPRHAEMG
jgi:hypothetical protein